MPSSEIPFTIDVHLYHTDFEKCFLRRRIWCRLCATETKPANGITAV